MNRTVLLRPGLCRSVVCTPGTVEEATDDANDIYPTGISSQWALADTEDAIIPCMDDPNRRHLLMEC